MMPVSIRAITGLNDSLVVWFAGAGQKRGSAVAPAMALEMLYAALAEDFDSALLYGEPGCEKSTLALKFAWRTQGAFDAVVFQLCGQRPVAEIAAELAMKLKLGLETRPPEEQIAAAKAWLAECRALLVLDDI
jgi:hypothetical protein